MRKYIDARENLMDKKAILFVKGDIDMNFVDQYLTENNLNFPIYCTDGAYHKIKQNIENAK